MFFKRILPHLTLCRFTPCDRPSKILLVQVGTLSSSHPLFGVSVSFLSLLNALRAGRGAHCPSVFVCVAHLSLEMTALFIYLCRFYTHNLPSSHPSHGLSVFCFFLFCRFYIDKLALVKVPGDPIIQCHPSRIRLSPLSGLGDVRRGGEEAHGRRGNTLRQRPFGNTASLEAMSACSTQRSHPFRLFITAPAPTPRSSWAAAGSTSPLRGLGRRLRHCPR